MPGGLLQPEQRQWLEDLAVNDAEDSLKHRARVVLGFDDGQKTREIAEAIGISASSVRYWRGAFREKGMDIFPESEEPRQEATVTVEPENVLKLPPATSTSDSAVDSQTAVDSFTIDELRVQYQSGRRDKKHAQNLAITLFDQTRQIHHRDIVNSCG